IVEPGPGGVGRPGAGGNAFPPLKRRIRPIPPDKAAAAWLARFRALAGDREASRTESGGAPGSGAGTDGKGEADAAAS
ncbi:MAG: hypothetical protein OXH14_09155, partial [Alphaproteobacteria bacterium]|nr:hypothetical protein [Alphaproteobacteria bacterium]